MIFWWLCDTLSRLVSVVQLGTYFERGGFFLQQLAQLFMSRKLDSVIHQTQMAATLFKGYWKGEFHGSKKMEGRPPRRRRVFVQTETGCVLGMELDRSDNAHTVKRRLQLALNVNTEESSLTFGDVILNNDLSKVRNDCPLLLRRNSMHRSSSTPCLSPRGNSLQQKDQSALIEILGCSNRIDKTNEIVSEMVQAMKIGVNPIPVHSGLGGAYYFRNSKGESVAIVKPTDEEPFAPNNPKGFTGRALGQPGLKRSVRVGETGFREVAAYLLDHNHFANVPQTVLVKITHSVFNLNDSVNGNKLSKGKKVSKIASLQQFIIHDYDASDHGTSSFPVDVIHRIGILDVRIFNTDRHSGNLLVRKLDGVGRFGQVELIPIDHGLCLPESLEDPFFEWIYWPQASIPFSDDELEYINNLDPIYDSEMLRTELPMIREACLRVLVLSTIFLKEAASFGLCLSEIGQMMTREFRGHEEEPSELEAVCLEAQRVVSESKLLLLESQVVDEVQFGIDCDYPEESSTSKSSSPIPNMSSEDILKNGFRVVNGHNPLCRLTECMEKDKIKEPDMVEKINCQGVCDSTPNVPKLSVTLKQIGLDEKSQQHHGVKEEMGDMQGSVLTTRRSASEQLPADISFVRLADVSDEEWDVFIEKFKELLYPAFANRRSITIGQKLIQRLGTSCRF